MKCKIVALSVVVCVIGLAVIWLVRSPIGQTTYDAIALGMTESEATALVPTAPGTIAFTSLADRVAEAGTTQLGGYDAHVETVEPGVFVYFDARTNKQLGKIRAWQTHEYGLQLLFSTEGKVIGKSLCRFKDPGARWWHYRFWFLP